MVSKNKNTDGTAIPTSILPNLFTLCTLQVFTTQDSGKCFYEILCHFCSFGSATCLIADEENKSIMQTTIQELFPVKNIATPYMYHHIVEALFEAGLDEEAIHLMKSYWGKMISLGADTYWEAFDPDQPEYSPYGSPIVNSYCHAWSCTPVYLLKKYVKNK